MILKAVRTPNMLIKLINHGNWFWLQPSMFPRGSTDFLKVKDGLGAGSARDRRSNWWLRCRSQRASSSHILLFPLAVLVSYSLNTHKQLLKIPKCGRKSTLWSSQKPPRLSLKYCSHLTTLSPQVFNPKTIYWAPRQRAIFLSQPLFPDPWNEVSGISSLFPLCLSPADLIFHRRFPEPITAASGGQAESANASSEGLGPGDKCRQH